MSLNFVCSPEHVTLKWLEVYQISKGVTDKHITFKQRGHLQIAKSILTLMIHLVDSKVLQYLGACLFTVRALRDRSSSSRGEYPLAVLSSIVVVGALIRYALLHFTRCGIWKPHRWTCNVDKFDNSCFTRVRTEQESHRSNKKKTFVLRKMTVQLIAVQQPRGWRNFDRVKTNRN